MLQTESPLVTVDWLYKHLEAENLVILDATIPKFVRTSIEDNLGYIPNSLFFDIKKKFSNISADFPNTIPTSKQFQSEARELGINSNSCIIVYDAHGIYSSPRAWWLFKYFGHTNIAVLDGGLPEWMSKKYATQKKYSSPQAKGDFIADIKEELFTNFSGVNRFSKIEDTLIFDARSFERFRGEVPEPRKGLRSGIIPNSVNLPYTKLLNGHTLKSEEELKSVFETFANNRERFVFSCGSGVTACNLALGASVVGYKNLVVYDGSWTEYGTLTPIPMETSNWNKDELMAYILLYAAHSDFKENNHERNVIISKVDMQTFQKVHDEFSQDNDFQSIQKILASIETHKYSSEKIDEILADIKGLFFADSDFDIKEHSMLLFLKRILK
ncbi:sulfurtransferase [uncultured Winogradskyella sp.]|jgi:thiosulfate/3-mercaptopyruvate sulfurtransferase|uniref:sulfurtransferase n=1 Tax=uncultured Winogradskyella sp. TaxID=395353 RepID=UPI0025D3FD0E|nr:sulfurtransferase [uncultured Winogradskyella sp.]